MISLLLPPGTDESRRNCKGEKPTAENDAAESRTDKGTGLSYVELAAAASGPLGGVRCAFHGVRSSDRRVPRRAAARHAVPGAPRRFSTRSVSLPSRMPGDAAIPAVCASASRRPSCRSAQQPLRLGRRLPSAPHVWGFATAEAGHRHNQLHRRTSASLVHPHKAGWPPTAVVARGTGREYRLSSVTVPDQTAGLAPEALVERMRMSDLCRDGLATVRAAAAQRWVPLCSVRAPPRWQEAQPDLTAPNGGAPVGAAARWTARAVRWVPRVDRSA